jgi:hypothetical protein
MDGKQDAPVGSLLSVHGEPSFGVRKNARSTPNRCWRNLAETLCQMCSIGSEANNACGTDQLCAGLEAGIEGAVHAIREL